MGIIIYMIKKNIYCAELNFPFYLAFLITIQIQ